MGCSHFDKVYGSWKQKFIQHVNLNINHISGLPNTNLIFRMCSSHSSMTILMLISNVIIVALLC